MEIAVLPSLLAADPGRLADECRRAAASGADALHVDIMDSHFVPNLSFGPAIVAMARRTVGTPLSVHLMMSRPARYVNRFVEAGGASVQIHIEASCNVPAVLAAIRRAGARCGLTLKPATPPEAVYPLLRQVDEILVMTVEPGYGGQAFLPAMLPKISAIRRQAQRQAAGNLPIMVDGGINAATAAQCAAHGASAFVAGTALFGLDDIQSGVAGLRRAAADAYGTAL